MFISRKDLSMILQRLDDLEIRITDIEEVCTCPSSEQTFLATPDETKLIDISHWNHIRALIVLRYKKTHRKKKYIQPEQLVSGSMIKNFLISFPAAKKFYDSCPERCDGAGKFRYASTDICELSRAGFIRFNREGNRSKSYDEKDM